MCCSDPPPPPDLGPMSEASVEVAQMAQQTQQDQLAWAKEQDASNRELLQQVLGVQLPAMQAQFDIAQADRKRYEDFFRPFEDKFAKEAAEYDSPERRERERGAAIADVSSAFDAQRRNATQRLEGYGVDPSTVRNAALDIGVRTQQAMAQAGAATGATRRVEDIGRALQSDVINLGRGALSNAAGFYGQAVGAGGAAQQGAYGATQAGVGANQSAMGWGGQALQGQGQGANIMSQGYGNQMQGYNAKQAQTAGLLQGIGGFAGMAIPGMADGGEIEGVPTGPIAAQQQQGMPMPGGIPFQQDGEVYGPGDGSGIDDQVSARLSEGEFVIPADVVRKKGEEFFEKLIEQYHTPASQQRGA